ncbi:hypothetical protein MEA186_28817 [Mesorhizobium amorphae CCNWGS0123]|uniref:Uncharacterized protein n=1 Tax=Mesorhizobium amorphae CCNWGS0123 TaxID=1082933 RepID=G6YIE3_9HYPH|nr:hypothetical protein MEA186_28817 [Mesorhizobium amorphae CCNWGS0123]
MLFLITWKQYHFGNAATTRVPGRETREPSELLFVAGKFAEYQRLGDTAIAILGDEIRPIVDRSVIATISIFCPRLRNRYFASGLENRSPANMQQIDAAAISAAIARSSGQTRSRPVSWSHVPSARYSWCL